MNKKISKHIKDKDQVKVYITDEDKFITHFNGFIFDQNDKFILMGTTHDFYYDGMAVVRKSDISEIRNSDNEKFFTKILNEEKITDAIFERRKSIPFSLNGFEEMFTQLKALNLPVIVECNYGKDEEFSIGSIEEIHPKKVKINYFNSRGEIDFKPVTVKYKNITSVKIDDPYANIFSKYVFQVD